jgi:isocitrate dehydrogenase
MTKDLALLIAPDAPWQSTEEFMNTIDTNLARKLGA